MISENLFIETYKLIEDLKRYELDNKTNQLCKSIEKQIQDKFTAMEKRKVFTEYKTSKANSEEREVKRREYLESTDIHRDWQTKKEIHFNEQ